MTLSRLIFYDFHGSIVSFFKTLFPLLFVSIISVIKFGSLIYVLLMIWWFLVLVTATLWCLFSLFWGGFKGNLVLVQIMVKVQSFVLACLLVRLRDCLILWASHWLLSPLVILTYLLFLGGFSMLIVCLCWRELLLMWGAGLLRVFLMLVDCSLYSLFCKAFKFIGLVCLFCLLKLLMILIGWFAPSFGKGKWIALGVLRLLGLMIVFNFVREVWIFVTFLLGTLLLL